MAKPNVLVLGGVGFIGRNLVTYLVNNDFAGYIRVADKVLPTTAYLGSPHSEAFANPIVEFKQCNLANDAGINRAYELADNGKFDFVFNLAAETKYGQTDEVYAEKILTLSTKLGEAAVRFGAGKFVETSTAQVYSEGKKASKEDAKLEPWTGIGKYKLQAETALRQIQGLPLIIVRPATVYGPGDISGISPRIICGAVYKYLGEKMKLLWSGDLKISTVHVRDVCAALWHLANNAQTGTIWNLADKHDSTQEKINTFISAIFGIKTGFYGNMLSSVAKMKLKEVTEEINDKHLKPWSDLCKATGINNTPLTPYIDQELLYNYAYSIDGTAVESTGFRYSHPTMTEDLVREQLQYFVSQNLFPPQ